ncbi:Alpha/Beta hydrolase protein [Coniochaeta sp. 2T2.1]|nr:Alpha/Beta hydrolase protein [Coniochaeta sp. 2T2.1]
MLSIEELRKLSDMDPELEQMYRDHALGTDWKPLLTMHDLQTARNFVSMVSSIKRGSAPKPSARPYKTKDIQVPVRDGSSIPARVYSPRRPSARGCPCMYVCHGGAYVLGEIDTEEWLCELWLALGGIAVDAIYRHAPEYPFPIPVNDSYDGLKWVAEHHAELGINPSRGFIIAGESVGADIALVLAHLYAEEQPPLPPLTGLFLTCPMVMTRDTVPEQYKDRFISMEQNAGGPFITAESIEFIMSLYKADKSSPLAVPILFPDHSKLPKTYLQICGMDPLRDGGLIFEQVLKDCGVETKVQVYPGLPHAFWAPFMHAEFTKKHTKDSQEGLAWLLKG